MNINFKKLVESNSASYDDLVEFISENGKTLWKGTLNEAINEAQNYNIKKYVNPTEGFNKASMAVLVEAVEIEQPKKEDKYDLSDKNKVLNAIKYFNYTKDHEEEYARSIIDGMTKFGIGADEIKSDNRLIKYIDSCAADLPSEDKNEESDEQPKEEKKEEIDKGEENLEEALFDALMDDTDEPLFEDLNHAEKRRWRIIKNTMKFVNFESVQDAFPSLNGKSNKEIIRQLKYMLEQLPEEKKRALIQNHQAKELEAKTLGIGKGHHIAGNIVAGAGGGTTGAAGLAGTAIVTNATVDSIMASTSAAAGAAGSATGAVATAFAGALTGVIVGGIIAVGGLALTALAVGTTIGIAKGVSNANMKKAQRRHATMMNQEGILKELKKYTKPKEDESKSTIQAKSLKLALAEAKIPGEHQCPNCGATLDAWDGTFCDKKCKEEYENRNKPEEKKETTNEELLTEKPLYMIDDDGKPIKDKEITKPNGEHISSKKEADEYQSTGRALEDSTSDKGFGCFAPDGTYIGKDNKGHKVAFFKHVQDGKYAKEDPTKIYPKKQ